MPREFASGIQHAEVATLPAASANPRVTLSQGGKLWFSDGTNWIDLGAAAQLGTATPAALGTAAPGAASAASREDHVHPMPTAAQVGAGGLTTANTWTGDNTYTQNVTIGDGTTARNLTVQGATSGADSGAFVGVRLGSTGFVYPVIIGNRSAIIGGAHNPQGILWSNGSGLPFDVVCPEGLAVNGNTVWHAGNSAQVQAGTTTGQFARWNQTTGRYEAFDLLGTANDWIIATAGQTLADGAPVLAIITTTQNFPLPTSPTAGDRFVVGNARGSTAGALVRVQTGAGQQIIGAAVGDDVTVAPGETIYLVARSASLLEIV